MEQHDEPETPEAAERSGLTKADIRWILGGVLAIIFGVFIAQNAVEIKIHFVFFTANIRLIWVFLICAVLGAVIDRLLQWRGLLPSTRRARREERRNKGRQ